ncbi:MAG: hypothetical protein QW478_12310 [Candidatus Micrarchaeaceae archaeon]
MKEQNLKQEPLTKREAEVLKIMSLVKKNGLIWYWDIEDSFDTAKDRMNVMDIVDKLEELKYIKPVKVKGAANAEYYKITNKGTKFLENKK